MPAKKRTPKKKPTPLEKARKANRELIAQCHLYDIESARLTKENLRLHQRIDDARSAAPDEERVRRSNEKLYRNLLLDCRRLVIDLAGGDYEGEAIRRFAKEILSQQDELFDEVSSEVPF